MHSDLSSSSQQPRMKRVQARQQERNPGLSHANNNSTTWAAYLPRCTSVGNHKWEWNQGLEPGFLTPIKDAGVPKQHIWISLSSAWPKMNAALKQKQAELKLSFTRQDTHAGTLPECRNQSFGSTSQTRTQFQITCLLSISINRGHRSAAQSTTRSLQVCWLWPEQKAEWSLTLKSKMVGHKEPDFQDLLKYGNVVTHRATICYNQSLGLPPHLSPGSHCFLRCDIHPDLPLPITTGTHASALQKFLK